MTAPIDWNDEAEIGCSQLPSCRDGEHSASCEISLDSAPDADPSVTDWRPTGLSPSAQLRKVSAENERLRYAAVALRAFHGAAAEENVRLKAALAASQSDLTTALVERDEADKARRDADRAGLEVARKLAEEKRLHAVTADQLANAVGELNQLRSDENICSVTICRRCSKTIWCQESREQVPGATGYFQHFESCPETP
jgi:hypothetical protein